MLQSDIKCCSTCIGIRANLPGHCPQRVSYEGSSCALSASSSSSHPKDEASFGCVWTMDMDVVASLHGAMSIANPCSAFLLLKTPTNPASRTAFHPYHPNAQERAPTPFAVLVLEGQRLPMLHQRSGRRLHKVMVMCRSPWSLLWSLKACPCSIPFTIALGVNGPRKRPTLLLSPSFYFSFF